MDKMSDENSSEVGKSTELNSFDGLKHHQNIRAEKFMCITCGKCFASSTDLTKHKEFHPVLRKSQKPHKCHLCISAFFYIGGLETHMKKCHPFESSEEIENPTSILLQKFECELCNKTFLTKDGLGLHMNIHSERFKCAHCGECFTTAVRLKKHQQLHIINKHLCLECKMMFRLQKDLDTHRKNCIGDRRPFKCSVCTRRFATKAILAVHKNVHLEKFKCNICSTCFPTRQKLSDHTESIHAPNGKQLAKYKCSQCLQTFRFQDALKIHMRECNSSAKQSMESQHSVESNSIPILQFKCEGCQKMFESLVDAKLHMNVHLKLHQCRHCERCVVNKRDLIKHEQAHINKKLQCLKCNATFKLQKVLNNHRKTCTGKRSSFKCSQCSKSFLSKSVLVRHKNIHLERFKCSICDKCFENRQALSVHLKMHASGKLSSRYECARCKRTFRTREDLKIHIGECNNAQRQLRLKEENSRFTQQICPVTITPADVVSCDRLEESSYLFHRPTIEVDVNMSEENDNEVGKCKICSKEFKSANAFKCHMNIHWENFKCKTCARCFASAIDLNRHCEIHGSRSKSHKCRLCVSKFFCVKDLNKHVRICHPLEGLTESQNSTSILFRKFKCERCDKVFLTAGGAKQHMNVHTERFKCAQCEECFSTDQSLKKHQQLHIDKKYTCLRCKRLFRLQKELDRHLQNCNGDPRPFKCLICSKGFSVKEELARHKNVHLERYKCTDCNKCFQRLKNLNYHMNNTHASVGRLLYARFECSRCLQRFRFQDALKIHMQDCNSSAVHTNAQSQSSVRGSIPVQQFKCEGCDKMFKSSNGAKQHMNVHLERFRCQLCEMCFSGKNDLMKHEQSHVLKKFQCIQCKCMFRLEKELNKHRKNCNGGRRPFVCSICSKCFISKQGLSQHEDIHLEKFKCSVCEKCCCNRHNLSAHMKLHAPGKLLNRFECKRVFHGREDVQVHTEKCNKIQKQQMEESLSQQKEQKCSFPPNAAVAVKCDRASITCDFCNTLCETKECLKRHCFDKHLNNFRAFSCLSCEHSSSSRRQIAVHCRNEHNNGKLFQKNYLDDEGNHLLICIFDSLLKKGIVVDL